MEELKNYALDALKEQIEALRTANTQDPDLDARIKISQAINQLAYQILADTRD